MSTESTNKITSLIMNRVLTFQPLTGAPLGIRLGGRMFKDWPSEDGPNAKFPNCVMRLINRISGGVRQQPQWRETPSVEFMLYDNSRVAVRVNALEDMADLIDAALFEWVDSSSGLLYSVGRQRDTLPPPVDPASRHSNAIRLVHDFTLVPVSITQYAT